MSHSATVASISRYVYLTISKAAGLPRRRSQELIYTCALLKCNCKGTLCPSLQIRVGMLSHGPHTAGTSNLPCQKEIHSSSTATPKASPGRATPNKKVCTYWCVSFSSSFHAQGKCQAQSQDGTGFLSACCFTRFRYSTFCWVNIINASACAGLLGFGSSKRSCAEDGRKFSAGFPSRLVNIRANADSCDLCHPHPHEKSGGHLNACQDVLDCNRGPPAFILWIEVSSDTNAFS